MKQPHTTVLLALTAVTVAAIGAGIPKPSARAPIDSRFLVSGEWLAEHLADPSVVVLHVGRDSATYLAGHVPGARFLQISAIVIERNGLPNELPPVAALDSAFESVGVSDASQVVLYDDFQGLWAARVFFTLDYLGRGSQAALLDGGLEIWKADGRAVTTQIPPFGRGTLTANPRPGIVVDAGWVRAHLGAAGIVLIDARPSVQYTGQEPGGGIERPGHLPGAVNFYWQDALVSSDRPILRDRETLEWMYRDRGVARGDTIVTYCRTGVQSSHAYWLARHLGFPVKMYDGSYIDWSQRKELPVER